MTSAITPTLKKDHGKPGIQVDLAQSASEVASIESDWRRLEEADPDPNSFASIGWFRAWLNHAASETVTGTLTPYVFKLDLNGTMVGLAPLVRRTSRRIPRIRKLGFVTYHSDYNDLLLGSRAAIHWSALAESLAQRCEDWEFADFRELRDTGEGTRPLELALQKAGLFFHVIPEDEGCPYLEIEDGAKAPMQRLSGHVRRTLRRRMERAQADGLTARVVERPDLEPGLIDVLSSLDTKKQAHRASPTFFAAHSEVFRELFNYFGPKNEIYVALVEAEGYPIAFQLGFRCGGNLWDYTKAYDRSYSRYAPGTLLLPTLLNYCVERGFHEYDFLRGEEEYKLLWSTGIHRRSRVVVWNRRWVSRLSATLFLKYRAN